MIDLTVFNPFLVTGILVLTLGGEILGIIALATWILNQYDFYRKVKQITAAARVEELKPVADTPAMTEEVKVNFNKRAEPSIAEAVTPTVKKSKVAAKPKVRGMDD